MQGAVFCYVRVCVSLSVHAPACLCVFHGSNCGMATECSAAWADLLRSGCAEREVTLGGEVLVQCSSVQRGNGDDLCGSVLRAGATIGDDGVVTLADAARRHHQVTMLLIERP